MALFLKNLLELVGVVFLRFHPLPRIWGVWLVAVNLACLLLITHIEAQVVLATTVIAVAVQAFIYQRTGFTRILGSTHILWLPMFAWMATRVDVIAKDPELATWLAVLLITNLVSAAVDTIDAIRFLRGERAPHYHWNVVNQA